MLIKPTNDYAFKSLFKRYPDILSYFLNAILKKEKIKIQNFLDPELPALIASKKQSFLDVLCSDEDGCRYIIEMQVAHQPDFIKRAQYYAARAYGNQLDRKENYGILKEIKFIAITDFILFREDHEYKRHHEIFDKDTYEKELKDFSFIFLELPKFKKTFLELETDLDRWMYFFKFAHQMTFTEKSGFVDKNPIFGAAFNHLDKISQSEEESQFYEIAEKQERDRANIIYAQREKFKEALKDMGKSNEEIETILNKIDN